MAHSAASEMRDVHFEECFYDICSITTFDSSFTVPIMTVFTASIKSFQCLLPSEILTAATECEWHKTATVFCDHDQNVAADACARHSLKPHNCSETPPPPPTKKVRVFEA